MSANIIALRPGSATAFLGGYPDAPVQVRLAAVMILNLAAVPACFVIENFLLPWQMRMDTTTPGWCFLLAQAGVVGFVAALTIREGVASVVEALLAATLLGYVYVFIGTWMIDPRRAVQSAHLIFRAVELGMVSVAAMAIGATVRLLLRQRLTLFPDGGVTAGRTYGLRELMFLIVVFAVGMELVTLFFDHFDRETQLYDCLLAVVRSLPATLPWLWGVTQRRLSRRALAIIVGATLGLIGLKALLAYALTGGEPAAILEQAVRRGAAYAAGATLNGLLLRGLGFSWCRG